MRDEHAAFGLQFGHGLGVGLYEFPMISRLHSLDAPVELEVGMVFALETYCAASDGRSAARIEEEVVVTPTGPRGDHALPGGRAARHRPDVRARRGLRARRPRPRAGRDRLARWRRSTSSGPRPPTSTATSRSSSTGAMLLIRGFEDRVQSLFLRGEVYGTTHLYSGQEAVATGFAERAARGRPDRVHLPRARPPARDGSRSRRRCSPSCSAARPGSTAAARAR